MKKSVVLTLVYALAFAVTALCFYLLRPQECTELFYVNVALTFVLEILLGIGMYGVLDRGTSHCLRTDTAVHHIRHDTLLLPVQRPRLRDGTFGAPLRRMQGSAHHRCDNIRRTGVDGGDSDTAELLQRGEPVAAGLDSYNHRFEPRAVGARGLAPCNCKTTQMNL